MPKINAFESNPTVIRRLTRTRVGAGHQERRDDRYKDHRCDRLALAKEAIGLIFNPGPDGLTATPIAQLGHYRL